jgi:hypothetical protein
MLPSISLVLAIQSVRLLNNMAVIEEAITATLPKSVSNCPLDPA